MSILLYFQIGFFFSLFIKVINDFVHYPKDVTTMLDEHEDYSGISYILLGLFWPFYIALFLLILIRNAAKIRNKKK